MKENAVLIDTCNRCSQLKPEKETEHARISENVGSSEQALSERLE